MQQKGEREAERKQLRGEQQSLAMTYRGLGSGSKHHTTQYGLDGKRKRKCVEREKKILGLYWETSRRRERR